MKIYHYTTIESLAMILSTKTLKFSRLDRVDDLEECIESKNVRLGQYVFVSCWTEDKEESIPLWKMYSGNNHGVRIALDTGMFDARTRKEVEMPNGLIANNCYMAGLTDEEILKADYFILPVISSNSGLFYCQVEYVDDINEKTNDAYHLKIEKDNQALSHVAFGEIGKYKNKRWKFQQESRFRLVILPVNISKCNADDAGTLMLNAILQSKPLPIAEFFLRFQQSVLDDLEVTLHPNSTMSDRIIVESLCARYAPKAKIADSTLKGRVLIK